MILHTDPCTHPTLPTKPKFPFQAAYSAGYDLVASSGIATLSHYTTMAYEGHCPTMMHTTPTPVMLLSPSNAVVSTCTRHGLDARLWLAATISCIAVVFRNAASKATTCIEDASDCLLGPFDILMALVYDGGLHEIVFGLCTRPRASVKRICSIYEEILFTAASISIPELSCSPTITRHPHHTTR